MKLIFLLSSMWLFFVGFKSLISQLKSWELEILHCDLLSKLSDLTSTMLSFSSLKFSSFCLRNWENLLTAWAWMQSSSVLKNLTFFHFKFDAFLFLETLSGLIFGDCRFELRSFWAVSSAALSASFIPLSFNSKIGSLNPSNAMIESTSTFQNGRMLHKFCCKEFSFKLSLLKLFIQLL